MLITLFSFFSSFFVLFYLFQLFFLRLDHLYYFLRREIILLHIVVCCRDHIMHFIMFTLYLQLILYCFTFKKSTLFSFIWSEEIKHWWWGAVIFKLYLSVLEMFFQIKSYDAHFKNRLTQHLTEVETDAGLLQALLGNYLWAPLNHLRSTNVEIGFSV